MRIGELSAATGVSASRIRFYETAGLLAPDGRTATGYRVYGESAVQALREKLTAIEELQERLSRTKSKLRNAAPTTSTASSPVSGLPSNRWLLTMCYQGAGGEVG
jgi:DNA-binding transcriptional MerR regulator